MRSEVRIFPDPPFFGGAIAQLGERLPCTQEVGGSIPPGSTIYCLMLLHDASLQMKGIFSFEDLLLFNNLEISDVLSGSTFDTDLLCC